MAGPWPRPPDPMLLLDTHVVLWWLGGSDRVSLAATAAITAGDCRVSVLALAEIEIKRSTGRLDAPELIDSLPPAWGWLPLLPTHAARLRDLPLHHRDPFDRLLVAQALIEGATIVSADAQLRRYGVPVVW